MNVKIKIYFMIKIYMCQRTLERYFRIKLNGTRNMDLFQYSYSKMVLSIRINCAWLTINYKYLRITQFNWALLVIHYQSCEIAYNAYFGNMRNMGLKTRNPVLFWWQRCRIKSYKCIYLHILAFYKINAYSRLYLHISAYFWLIFYS